MNIKNTKNTATSKSASALAAEFVDTVGAMAAAKVVRSIVPKKPATCELKAKGNTAKAKAQEDKFFTDIMGILHSFVETLRPRLDDLEKQIKDLEKRAANAAKPPTAAGTPKASANHAAISAAKTGKTVPPKTWKEALKAYAAAHPKKNSDDVIAACAKLYPALHAATIKPMIKTTSNRSK